jgi:hypothetical protein
MTAGYQHDRIYADQYIPEIQRLVRLALIKRASIEPAPFHLDVKEATDLIVMRTGELRIAARIRRPEYLARYRLQFTIRSARLLGNETELSKIEKGFADWMFYGFGGEGKLVQWVILDLDVFRREWMGEGREKIKYRWVSNNDREKTFLHAFQVASFSPEIIIDMSENLKAFIDPNLGVPYIDKDLKPANDAEMAYRLARDAALQHWHTHPEIKVPFDDYWASLPKPERGDAKGFSRDIPEK